MLPHDSSEDSLTFCMTRIPCSTCLIDDSFTICVALVHISTGCVINANNILYNCQHSSSSVPYLSRNGNGFYHMTRKGCIFASLYLRIERNLE